jgi:hypothetical protein
LKIPGNPVSADAAKNKINRKGSRMTTAMLLTI